MKKRWFTRFALALIFLAALLSRPTVAKAACTLLAGRAAGNTTVSVNSAETFVQYVASVSGTAEFLEANVTQVYGYGTNLQMALYDGNGNLLGVTAIAPAVTGLNTLAVNPVGNLVAGQTYYIGISCSYLLTVDCYFPDNTQNIYTNSIGNWPSHINYNGGGGYAPALRAYDCDATTPTFTFTPSPTFSISPTFSASPTVSATPSITLTYSETDTYTQTPTLTDSPTPSCTLTQTVTPSITETSTLTPTVSETSTPSPSPSACPTVVQSPTGVQRVSSLGRNILGPVPARNGENICLYFSGNPASSDWQIYNFSGEKIAALSFGPSADPCWNTSGVAPGVYLVRISSGGQVAFQKVVVLK